MIGINNQESMTKNENHILSNVILGNQIQVLDVPRNDI